MATPAQIAANRLNAQKSTGPKSESGKNASSLNARKHGFRGQFFFAPAENEDEFWDLFHELKAEHVPQTPTEELLVQRMCEHQWLMRRAQTLNMIWDIQEGITRHQTLKETARQMDYMATHERGFSRCVRDLSALRAARLRQEIGFVRHNSLIAAETRKEELHDARLQKKLNAGKKTSGASSQDDKQSPTQNQPKKKTAVAAAAQSASETPRNTKSADSDFIKTTDERVTQCFASVPPALLASLFNR